MPSKFRWVTALLTVGALTTAYVTARDFSYSLYQDISSEASSNESMLTSLQQTLEAEKIETARIKNSPSSSLTLRQANTLVWLPGEPRPLGSPDQDLPIFSLEPGQLGTERQSISGTSVFDALSQRCAAFGQFDPLLAWSGQLIRGNSGKSTAYFGPPIPQVTISSTEETSTCSASHPRDVALVTVFTSAEVHSICGVSETGYSTSSLLANFLFRINLSRLSLQDALFASSFDGHQISAFAPVFRVVQQRTDGTTAYLDVQQEILLGGNNAGVVQTDAVVIALPNGSMALLVVAQPLQDDGDRLDAWASDFVRHFTFKGI